MPTHHSDRTPGGPIREGRWLSLALVLAGALASWGCTYTVELKGFSYRGIDGESMSLVAELDRDLEREFPYILFMDYAVVAPGQFKTDLTDPDAPQSDEERAWIRKVGSRLLSQGSRQRVSAEHASTGNLWAEYLAKGVPAFRLPPGPSGPPFLYEIRLPLGRRGGSWDEEVPLERGKRYLVFLRFSGTELTDGWFPFLASGFESNICARIIQLQD